MQGFYMEKWEKVWRVKLWRPLRGRMIKRLCIEKPARSCYTLRIIEIGETS